MLDVLESAALRLTGSSRGLARTRAAAEALDGTDDRLAELTVTAPTELLNAVTAPEGIF